MNGVKFKLAHRRADTGKWSVNARTQRRNLVKLLREMIASLEVDIAPATPVAKMKPKSGRTPKERGGRTVRSIATARKRAVRKSGARKGAARQRRKAA